MRYQDISNHLQRRETWLKFEYTLNFTISVEHTDDNEKSRSMISLIFKYLKKKESDNHLFTYEKTSLLSLFKILSLNYYYFMM